MGSLYDFPLIPDWIFQASKNEPADNIIINLLKVGHRALKIEWQKFRINSTDYEK